MATGHKTCCWVTQAATIGRPAQFCGKPSTYTNPKDDDDNRYRKYSNFCAEHLKQIEAQQDDEEF